MMPRPMELVSFAVQAFRTLSLVFALCLAKEQGGNMSKAALARLRMGSRAFGMAAALSFGLMATGAYADMQSGAVRLGGVKFPDDIQYKGLPGALQIATLY